VENQYSRVLDHDGNRAARLLIREVFELSDRNWRGIGSIPKSGFRLRPEYRDFDAERLFSVEDLRADEDERCISGRILKGIAKPIDCPAFGGACRPEHPLGATMVSAEGACAAYHRYGRRSASVEA